MSISTHRANLPIGADLHIKYQSKSNFGAILICAKPITLTAYNDETFIRSWVTQNTERLSKRHGPQIRRYGLILVTTTYRAPQCSITAWTDKDKEVLMSAKVKAQMLGDDGVTLDSNDQLTDKDWTLYAEGPKKDRVVVFFDGFQYPAWDWWWEGLKLGLGRLGQAQEKTNRGKDASSLVVRQATMNGQHPLRTGLPPRESLVGQRKRSWDGKAQQRNGLLDVQSPPRSRRASPVNGQSRSGICGAQPSPADEWQHSIPMPLSRPARPWEGMFKNLWSEHEARPFVLTCAQRISIRYWLQ